MEVGEKRKVQKETEGEEQVRYLDCILVSVCTCVRTDSEDTLYMCALWGISIITSTKLKMRDNGRKTWRNILF